MLQIIAGLYANRRITHYTALIPMPSYNVDIEDYHTQYNPAFPYDVLSGRWMQALQRCLSGTGHPEHEMFASPSQQVPFGAAFRATLFLRAISGSRYLPRGSVEDSEKLKLKPVL